MTYTLRQLDHILANHHIPASVIRTVPGLKDRHSIMRQVKVYRDLLSIWAQRASAAQRQGYVAVKVGLERELGDVLARVFANYKSLGIEPDTKPDALEAAWDEASDVLHRHARDQELLGDDEQVLAPGLEGVGMITTPSPDPLLEAGRRIKKGLAQINELQQQISRAAARAEAVDPDQVDAAHLALMNEYERRGMVLDPSQDGRPVMDDDLARRLAQIGLDPESVDKEMAELV